MNVLAQAAGAVTTGEAITFWILGPIALAGALGMVFARNAVHSALMLVVTMFCLAVFYIAQQAPFLGFVQIIVYTGAVMMLFLFVLMLVGRDSSDSVVEVLRGQRLAALALGVGLARAAGRRDRWLAHRGHPGRAGRGRSQRRGATSPGSAGWCSPSYLFAFELTSALLITAALGAMVLTYGLTRGAAKPGQRATVEARLRGEHDRISPLPGPGVFATGNSVAVPAVLPDGSIAPESISAIIDATLSEPVDEHPVDPHALTGGARRRTARRGPRGDPHLLPAALRAAVHHRRGGRAGAPQRHRRVHVHRADAQRGEPVPGHLLPDQRRRSTAR